MDAITRGATARMRREHNELAWHAHTTASLTRAKKMPPLKKLLLEDEGAARRKPKQDWKDQAAAMAAW